MIKKIKINKFRKLEDIEFEFSKGVNIISGTNGTCKTSLLHLISNSFKALNKKNNNFNTCNHPSYHSVNSVCERTCKNT